MTTTVEGPVIVCPDWCSVTPDEHLEELASPIAAGDIHHKSAPSAWATVAVALQADGSTLPDDETPTILGYADNLMTLEEADEAVRDFTAAAALLRTLVTP
jgi:hypothetical protein